MRFRLATPVLLVLIVAAVATLLGLGVWQVQRAGWKANLIATRNAQLAGQPLSAAEAHPLSGEALDYRLVALQGTWDADHVMILANRARFSVKGENIVQPFVLTSGEAVLVERGWYATGEREAALANLRSTSVGATSGLARYVEGARANRTGAGTWTALAPESMAAELPYKVLPWYVIEGGLLAADGGSRPASPPAQGFLPYTSTTPHIEYALTWFGIAAALIVIAVVHFVVEPRRAARRGFTKSE